jgi:hypothetical protein
VRGHKTNDRQQRSADFTQTKTIKLELQSQLVALDMLHHIKGIFCAYYVLVFFSRHSGFFHHQN